MAGVGEEKRISLVTNASSSDWIFTTFPQLSDDGYIVTSPPTDEYNCIAHVVYDVERWWSHLPGYYWPGSRTPYVSSLLSVLESEGFQVCDSTTPEEGFEKIAIYGKNGRWTHAARLQSDGLWTSKLGVFEDIEHGTLESIEGDLYGVVVQVLRREDQRSIGSGNTHR